MHANLIGCLYVCHLNLVICGLYEDVPDKFSMQLNHIQAIWKTSAFSWNVTTEVTVGASSLQTEFLLLSICSNDKIPERNTCILNQSIIAGLASHESLLSSTNSAETVQMYIYFAGTERH